MSYDKILWKLACNQMKLKIIKAILDNEDFSAEAIAKLLGNIDYPEMPEITQSVDIGLPTMPYTVPGEDKLTDEGLFEIGKQLGKAFKEDKQ